MEGPSRHHFWLETTTPNIFCQQDKNTGLNLLTLEICRGFKSFICRMLMLEVLWNDKPETMTMTKYEKRIMWGETFSVSGIQENKSVFEKWFWRANRAKFQCDYKLVIIAKRLTLILSLPGKSSISDSAAAAAADCDTADSGDKSEDHHVYIMTEGPWRQHLVTLLATVASAQVYSAHWHICLFLITGAAALHE